MARNLVSLCRINNVAGRSRSATLLTKTLSSRISQHIRTTLIHPGEVEVHRAFSHDLRVGAQRLHCERNRGGVPSHVVVGLGDWRNQAIDTGRLATVSDDDYLVLKHIPIG